MKRIHCWPLLGLALMAATRPMPARADEVLVSAASSLTDAFTDIGGAYSKAYPGTTVRFNFAASGALQQQIEQGAPVDVFASAATKEMDALQRQRLIVVDTRTNFASNRLVLIVSLGSKLRSWNDLGSGSVKRLAISSPDSVPSGRYARDTLTHRGLWSAVQAKGVLGENVRQTLAYVMNGDVDAGIVFATDALTAKNKVRVVQTAVPGKDHGLILYPAAVLKSAPNAPSARRFVAFLQTDAAQSILTHYGFRRVGGAIAMKHLPEVHPRSVPRPAHGHK